MQAADVLALSSWNEGVPNVVLEAFATGLPVVATRVGGLAEVVNRTELGMLTTPGDEGAFAEALRTVLTRDADGDVIVRWGRTFNWERAAGAYWELIRPANPV
jgi:glycosyltransferase involved in cell wall biosynthesis